MRHRVEAATITNDALLADLEAHAHDEMARGAWSSAVDEPDRRQPADAGARRSRAARAGGDRGDAVLGRRRRGAAARRADRLRRRTAARQRARLPRHVRRRRGGGRAAADPRVGPARGSSTTPGSPRRSRSAAPSWPPLASAADEAIEWAQRADGARTRRPRHRPARRRRRWRSGSASSARRAEAHAALDRWLDDPAAPRARRRLRPARAEGLPAPRRRRPARRRGRRSSPPPPRASSAACSSSPRCRSRARPARSTSPGRGTAPWSPSERAIALAVESEDRWVIALAHWSASDVPAARGDWPVAEAHVRAIQEQSPTFERHIAAEAIATAGLAAAQDRPGEVLRALAPLERMRAARGRRRPGVPAVAPPQGACARRRRRAGRGRAVHRLGDRAGDRPAQPAARGEAGARARQAGVRPARRRACHRLAPGGARGRRAARHAVRASAHRARARPGAPSVGRAARGRGDAARRAPAVRRARRPAGAAALRDGARAPAASRRRPARRATTRR